MPQWIQSWKTEVFYYTLRILHNVTKANECEYKAHRLVHGDTACLRATASSLLTPTRTRGQGSLPSHVSGVCRSFSSSSYSSTHVCP